MNAQQKKLLNIVRRANIDIFLFEEMEDRNSSVVNFINSFTLNYITTRLKSENRQEFVNLLENEISDNELWSFINKHIENFDEDFEEKLEKTLLVIKKKLLINSE